MNHSLPLIFIFFMLLGCVKKESNEFYIQGKITGDPIETVYLQYNNTIDSALVRGNSFSFQGKIESPTEAALFPLHPLSKDPMTLGVFMLESSEISLSATYQRRMSNGMWMNFLGLDSVTGSKSQLLKNSFEIKMDTTFYRATEDSVKAKLLYENLNEFISTHPKSELSGTFLYDLGTYFDLLSTDQLGNLNQHLGKAHQKRQVGVVPADVLCLLHENSKSF